MRKIIISGLVCFSLLFAYAGTAFADNASSSSASGQTQSQQAKAKAKKQKKKKRPSKKKSLGGACLSCVNK